MSLCVLQGAGYLDGYNAGASAARTGITMVRGTNSRGSVTETLQPGKYRCTYGLTGYGNYIAHAWVTINGTRVFSYQTPVQGNVGSYSMIYGDSAEYTLTEESEVTLDVQGYGATGMYSMASFVKVGD